MIPVAHDGIDFVFGCPGLDFVVQLLERFGRENEWGDAVFFGDVSLAHEISAGKKVAVVEFVVVGDCEPDSFDATC